MRGNFPVPVLSAEPGVNVVVVHPVQQDGQVVALVCDLVKTGGLDDVLDAAEIPLQISRSAGGLMGLNRVRVGKLRGQG